jgi:hypothetical protein
MGKQSGKSCRMSALTTEAGMEMPVYGMTLPLQNVSLSELL